MLKGDQIRRCLLLVAMVGAACQPAEGPIVPPALEGRWTSSAPAYRDRYFLIDDGTITLGQGDTVEGPLPIARIERETEPDGGVRYTIVYVDDTGQELRFLLTSSPDEPDVVWPTHQPNVRWQRSDPR